MVPADLKNYGPQIERLTGIYEQQRAAGATKDELNDLRRSLDELHDAAAAQQRAWEKSRPRDHDRDGGMER